MRFLGLFIFFSIIYFSGGLFGEALHNASSFLFIWYSSITVFLVLFSAKARSYGEEISDKINEKSFKSNPINVLSYELYVHPIYMYRLFSERFLLVSGSYLIYNYVDTFALNINESLNNDLVVFGFILIIFGYLTTHFKIKKGITL